MLIHFYEWKHWEGIMHHSLFFLTLYILYVFYKHKSARKFTNVLLFAIIVSIITLIHLIINIKNNNNTSYLVI